MLEPPDIFRWFKRNYVLIKDKEGQYVNNDIFLIIKRSYIKISHHFDKYIDYDIEWNKLGYSIICIINSVDF